MNPGYKLKKAWFAIWQKYKLEEQLKIASKLFLIFLVVWVIGSVLTIVSQWGFKGSLFKIEHLQHFWTVIIELVSGFDLPELKLNLLSRIISVIILITGIIIFAIFTGQIVSMFIHVLQRAHHLPEKPANFKFNRPIIICGINQKLDKIIEELRNSSLSHNREIVVVDDEADQLKITDKEKYRDVWCTQGNQANREVLKKVLGVKESSAVILSQAMKCSDAGDKRYSDSRAIETAMAIEGYRENTHTVLELFDERNIPYLKHTKINEWISIFEYGIKLVSQSALQQGMAKVYHHLLGGDSDNKKTNQIYFTRTDLPQPFNGLAYEEIRNKIIENPRMDIILIGFARYINPETAARLKLDLGNYPFIKQLNPVSKICKMCGADVGTTDELGRVPKKCPGCLKKEKSKYGNNINHWYFPKDTVINRSDKLIYLSDKEVEFYEHIKSQKKEE